MRLIKSLLALTAVVTLFFACRKEKSLEHGKIITNVASQWEFSATDLHYQGSMDSAVLSNSGTHSLTLSGTDSSGNGQIFLQLIGDTIVPGLYTNSVALFEYLEQGVVLYHNNPDQQSDFSIIITAIDSLTVTGTFSGTVTDGAGNSKTITNGKFSANIPNTTVTPTQGVGKLTVWAKQLCSTGSNIKVQIGTQVSEITTPSPQEPVCGAAGNPSFTLAAGLYTVLAVCGADTLKYNITVVDNTCTTLEIDFSKPPVLGDYLPLTMASFWDYQDLVNSSNTNRITVDGIAENLDGRNYTRCLTTFGDSLYFRKEGSVYYQYKKLDFQAGITDPPTVELEILHDDYAEGAEWESPPIAVTVQSIPIKVKFVSMIMTRDFQEDFFGVKYSNLIEVRTTLMISFDNGATFDDSGTSYSTIFSKGVGIVYYQDLGRDIQWGLKSYQVNP